MAKHFRTSALPLDADDVILAWAVGRRRVVIRLANGSKQFFEKMRIEALPALLGRPDHLIACGQALISVKHPASVSAGHDDQHCNVTFDSGFWSNAPMSPRAMLEKRAAYAARTMTTQTEPLPDSDSARASAIPQAGNPKLNQ